MTHSTHDGAEPVDDAAVADPPTVDQVMERQFEDPRTGTPAMGRRPPTAEELAAVEAGGDAVEDPDDLLIEGPNSA